MIDKIRVLSVLPVLGHPRDSKRIGMLQQAGFAVEAVAFERDYHKGRLPDCPVKRFSKIANGRYLQRILKLVLALPAMRQTISRKDIIYASGQDMAFLALIANFGLGKPVVLEVGDIRELQVAPGLKGRLVRVVDKFFTNKCSLLVATASDFIDTYYHQWLNLSIKGIVIENKLESSFAEDAISKETPKPVKGKPLVNRPLRIGYFGGLRCEWSWQVLEGLAKARPEDIEIVLAGYVISPTYLIQQAEKYENIKYLGQYRSPQDLLSLYNSVDLIWACYKPIGPNDWNLRWARTNRFYEACFFNKPIISRVGCSDSVEVVRYNIGLELRDEDVKKAVNRLCTITLDDLETWSENMLVLPREVYVYSAETEELARALKGLLKENLVTEKIEI